MSHPPAGASETVLPTPQGEARVLAYAADRPWMRLLLSHGAGGGLGAADLVLAARLLPRQGVDVLLVEQPWRLAGRRVAPPPARLDAAFGSVVEQVTPARPFVVGGRSAGARVGCRTASALGADGVLALAFPLVPPGRPGFSRSAELTGAGVPVAVVQGSRDTFGSDSQVREVATGRDVTVLPVSGADHEFAMLARDGGAAAGDAALRAALTGVRGWLERVAGRAAAPR